jgi:hypothetical protein
MSVHRSPRTIRLAKLAVVSVVAAFAMLGLATGPASSGQSKGSLVVISVNDSGTGLVGAVAGRAFGVVVEARDPLGVPLALSKATQVRLSSTGGPGSLAGSLVGTIARNATRGTISGATYSAFGNAVPLQATVSSGVVLDAGNATFDVASTAVRAQASPHAALSVTDPSCAAPTPDAPVCGYLQLPNGGNGTVLLSVGSCDTILTCRTQSGTTAQLVTADVNLKDGAGAPLYTRDAPATFILACDKVLCGGGGVAQLPVKIDLTNTGVFTTIAACPAKGTVGAGQEVCLDTVQSKRDIAGDTFSVVLFTHDIRGSYP